jgi:glycosyltransferase involved in cell wall biosynthesis
VSAHWLHVFATLKAGGPQMRTLQLVGRLPGVRHTFVAMDGRWDALDAGPPGARWERIEPPPRRGFFAMGRAMAALIGSSAPDLLLTYNWGAIESVLAARGLRLRRLVHHEEGFGPAEVQRQHRRRVWARRVLLRRAAAVVVPSRTLEAIALRRWRVPRERLHWLPNGVDLARFVPAPRAPHGDVVIGHVGGLRGEKNQQLLLRAFACMRRRQQARLLVVGAGEDFAPLAQLAADLAIVDRVTWAGASADTSEVYRDMDVFALSSRTEQMPLVVLEAMACGLPIVSTDVGDVAGMVAPENRAFIAPPDEPLALAVALDALVDDAGKRRAIGAANRARCERDWELGACLARYAALYERVQSGP